MLSTCSGASTVAVKPCSVSVSAIAWAIPAVAPYFEATVTSIRS
jgi:hypothetical protein